MGDIIFNGTNRTGRTILTKIFGCIFGKCHHNLFNTYLLRIKEKIYKMLIVKMSNTKVLNSGLDSIS